MTSGSYLHWSFRHEQVLLPTIVLSSWRTFLVACILVMIICLLERFITFLLENQWAPRIFKRSPTPLALWRTGLYFVATFLRLCYMLITMTFHIGLIITIVLALSTAQLVIELKTVSKPLEPKFRNTHETTSRTSLPLLSDNEQYHLKSVRTRPRSKSKPDDIFIHPAESNIARADAVAIELGLAGETDRVQAYTYTRDEPPAWEIGRGKDMAREMLLGSHTKQPSREHFYIQNDSDCDSSEFL